MIRTQLEGASWVWQGCKGEDWLVVQEDELEAAGLCSEMDQHEADLAAINKILGSPFVQRDAMRMSGLCKVPPCCFLLLGDRVQDSSDHSLVLVSQCVCELWSDAETACNCQRIAVVCWFSPHCWMMRL